MKQLLVLPVALLLAACSQQADDHSRSGWQQVLTQKKAATAPSSSPHQKQLYADALQGFVRTHPQHGRAREVYQRIQVDFANELAALGRYQDAIRFYRFVLTHDPANQEAQKGINDAMSRLSVTRDKLLMLEKGMSQHDVAKLLGKPIPGWKVTVDRSESTTESWYYRRRDGGIAAVHFIDGKVFAAEEKSDAKLAPLNAGLLP
jgi:tetratricopeptide (TPR) repeat protein